MWHDVFPEFDSVSEKRMVPDSLSIFDLRLAKQQFASLRLRLAALFFLPGFSRRGMNIRSSGRGRKVMPSVSARSTGMCLRPRFSPVPFSHPS